METPDQIPVEVRKEVHELIQRKDTTRKFAVLSVIFTLVVGGLVYWLQERKVQRQRQIITRLENENEQLKTALHDPGIRTYSNQQFRFSLQVPGDWVLVSENIVSTDGREFTTILRSKDFEEISGGVSQGARLSIRIQRPSTVKSIGEMSEFFKLNQFGHTQVREEVVQIAGQEALAHLLDDYRTGKLKDAHLLRGNDWFTIRYEYQDGNPKLEALYNQIVQSFTFLP